MRRRALLPFALPLMITLCAAMLLVGCGGSAGEASEAGSEWTVTNDQLTLEEDLIVTDSDDFYFGRIFDITVREDGRISVFMPDHDFAYSFTARAEWGGGPSFMTVPEMRPGYIFAYSHPMFPGDEKLKELAVRQADARGAVGDTLFTTRPPQLYIEQEGDRMSFYSIPFARRPRFTTGAAGNVHYAWNDSLGVASYDGDGQLLRTVDIPSHAVPVTEEDREAVMGEWSPDHQTLLRSEIPDTKPAFDRFLIDDAGRYWFKRPTEDHERAAWWVADPETQHVDVVSLPSVTNLMVVRDGYAYG